MTALVKAKCPQCKKEISVDQSQADQPAACPSCQSTFIPAAVIAESNKRFEMGMYAVMILVGAGLFIFMAITGRLQQKGNLPPAPPAAQQGNPPAAPAAQPGGGN